MIDLKQVYGNYVFDRKQAYSASGTISFALGLISDLLITWAIVKFLNIKIDHAFLKVFLALQAFGLVRLFYTQVARFLTYKLTLKKTIIAEITHYVEVFKNYVDWDEAGTYDDFFIDAAFSEKTPEKLKLLAAINYGSILNLFSLSPWVEDIFYKIYCHIRPTYTDQEGA